MFNTTHDILNGMGATEVQLRLAAAAAARLSMPFGVNGSSFNMPGLLPPSKIFILDTPQKIVIFQEIENEFRFCKI